MAYVGNIVSFIQYLVDNLDGYKVYDYAYKPDLSTEELIKEIESTLNINVPFLKFQSG